MISGQLIVNAPDVASEVIDGELIMMNLAKGTFYSSQGLGPEIWGWIVAGHELGAIRDALQARFDANAEVIERDLSAFTDRLLAESLVRVAPAAVPVDGAIELDAALTYRTPELAVYNDMQDLLMLDPIHEVDEVGWPTLPAAE